MATALSNNRKMYLTTAGVLVFGLAAYGLGRVYPPLGPSAGTIAPAERYVSSQVGEGDVTLGDTSVPQLMQTDAFQVMVKDANFRQLANDPGFAALASNPAVMSAIAANPAQFSALAKNPGAFHNLVQQASQLSAAGSQLGGGQNAALAAMAQNSSAFSKLAQSPGAFSALAGNASAFNALNNHPAAFSAGAVRSRCRILVCPRR